MPRVGLDRERVVAAAAVLADELGPERLTLAEVAKRLGVRLPSLYHHVAGLDGLHRELTLLALQTLTERLTTAAVGRSGRDAVFEMAAAYRSFALQRPGLYAFTVRATDPADGDLADAAGEVLGVVLAVLAGYGVTEDDAIDAARGLRALLHGWASLESAGGFGLPRDVERSFERHLDGFHQWLTAFE